MKPPPFLVSFSSLKDYKSALGDVTSGRYWREIEALAERKLPPVVSVRALATLFGVSTRFVGALGHNPERYYRTFRIRKGRKKREIQAPRVGLKVFQKWFGYHLAAAVTAPRTVFGFVPGRSAPEAASVHSGARWVYSLDLADFFPSTPRARVAEALRVLGYPAHGAELAATLCGYRGALAQGSPASPILSNIVFGAEDERLAELAAEFGIRLSRYADDIVFSGKGDVPPDLAPRAHAILEGGGWRINKEKEALVMLPRRLKVHGLLVHGAKPRLTKGYRNRLRAYRHLEKAGRIRPEDEKRLKGHIHYAASIDRLETQ